MFSTLTFLFFLMNPGVSAETNCLPCTNCLEVTFDPNNELTGEWILKEGQEEGGSCDDGGCRFSNAQGAEHCFCEIHDGGQINHDVCEATKSTPTTATTTTTTTTNPMPVDGNWGEWGEWGHVSTDSGVRERTRVCASPAPSSGGAYCEGGPDASSESQKVAFVMTGGWTDTGRTDTVEVFLPPGGPGCSTVPPLDTPRSSHVAINIGGSLVLCGGYTASGRTDSCVEFDTSWIPHSTLTTTERYGATTATLDGMPCLLGGYSSVQYSIECFDGTQWQALEENIPGDGAYYSCAANLQDGTLLVGGSGSNQVIQRSLSGVWDTSSWQQLPKTRAGHSCITFNQQLLVAGGLEDGSYTSSVLIIDLETKMISTTNSMTSARAYFSMIHFNKNIIALGGHDGNGYLDSAESFNEDTKQWTSMDYKLSQARGYQAVGVVSAASLGC